MCHQNSKRILTRKMVNTYVTKQEYNELLVPQYCRQYNQCSSLRGLGGGNMSLA